MGCNSFPRQNNGVINIRRPCQNELWISLNKDGYVKVFLLTLEMQKADYF